MQQCPTFRATLLVRLLLLLLLLLLLQARVEKVWHGRGPFQPSQPS